MSQVEEKGSCLKLERWDVVPEIELMKIMC